ncbi:MAG: hypothetical protein ACXADO_00620 [Candidatus Thorarchaeota archaeon]
MVSEDCEDCGALFDCRKRGIPFASRKCRWHHKRSIPITYEKNGKQITADPPWTTHTHIEVPNPQQGKEIE